VIAATLVLPGCGQQKTEGLPTAHELTTSAVGHFCGMNLMEHVGPKGQIILASRAEPVWFSSARKDIRAIYVSDMAKAPSWEEPGTTNWVEARKAVFVIESQMMGGMGAPETVPFSDRAAAEKFVAENGGRVVAFAEMPRDYVLGTGQTSASGPAAELELLPFGSMAGERAEAVTWRGVARGNGRFHRPPP
jgi:copper chaperone NosL